MQQGGIPLRVPRHREHPGRRSGIPAGRAKNAARENGRRVGNATEAAIEILHRHKMYVVGGLIVGNPNDTRESIEANLDFARARVDWPYIQHPTPYPGTPMTKDFRERGLIVNDRLEEYDGTTAVVRTRAPVGRRDRVHAVAGRTLDEAASLLADVDPQPVVRPPPRSSDAALHFPGKLLALPSRSRNRPRGLRAISIDQTAGTRQLHLTMVTVD